MTLLPPYALKFVAGKNPNSSEGWGKDEELYQASTTIYIYAV
jgi:hypothetical protein